MLKSEFSLPITLRIGFVLLSMTFSIAYAALDEIELEGKVVIINEPTAIETDEDLETVVVSAQRKKSNASKEFEIFSINQLALNNLQSQHIQEVLITTPGVNIQRGNGQEYLPAIRSPVLTGAGSCGAILTAEDGIPLRSAGFCNVNELFEAHSEIAQRIEVTRGSGTSLYGSNALHGMINVITPDPKGSIARISLETGSDEYARLKFISPLGTQEKVVLGLSVTSDGGFRDESGFDQQKLNLKYTNSYGDYEITAGFTGTNLNQETAGFIRGLDAYKDESLVVSNPTPEAYRDAKAMRGWFRYAKTLNENSSLVLTPYARHTEMQFLQHFLPGDPLEENGQTSIGLQSAYYTTLNASLELIGGIDAELTDAYLKQSQDNPTQGSAFLIATIPVGKHYDYEVSAKTLAAFIYADWSFSEQWNLVAGLRSEHVNYDYKNLMLTGRTREDGTECGFGGCRYSRPADRDDSFDNVSSHLGVNYQVSPNVRTYVKWSQGFRVPQATELYRLQRDQLYAVLDSETLKGYELGASLRLSHLNAKVSMYDQRKDNFIFRDSDFFNVSNGKTKHQGFELFADYEVSPKFDLLVNANYAKHTYDYSQVLNSINIRDNDIDTAPRRFGSVTLNWDVSDLMSSQIQLSHMGEYFLDPENLHSYTGHNLVNLRTQWRFTPKWLLSLRMNNVFDKRYAERADYTSFTQERYFPGRGRSFFISLEKRLN